MGAVENEVRGDSHVDADSPCEGDRELPAFALDRSLDVLWWEVVGKVDV